MHKSALVVSRSLFLAIFLLTLGNAVPVTAKCKNQVGDVCLDVKPGVSKPNKKKSNKAKSTIKKSAKKKRVKVKLPTRYPDKAVSHVVSKQKLRPKQKKAFTKYKRINSHFGAFAANGDMDTSWFAADASNLNAAIQTSIKFCQLASGNKGKCGLYAITLPSKLSKGTRKASGFGRSSARDFASVYQKKKSSGKWNAFALNQLHHFGSSNQNDTQAKAMDRALAQCRNKVNQAMSRRTTAQKNWLSARGYLKCRIVDVSGF